MAIMRLSPKSWLKKVTQLLAEEAQKMSESGEDAESDYMLVRVTERATGACEEIDSGDVEDGVPGLYRCLRRSTGNVVAECAISERGMRVTPDHAGSGGMSGDGLGAASPLTSIGRQASLLGESWHAMVIFQQRQLDALTAKNDELREECSALKEQLAERIAEQGESPYAEFIELAKSAMSLYETKQSTAGYAAVAKRILERLPPETHALLIPAINEELQLLAAKGH